MVKKESSRVLSQSYQARGERILDAAAELMVRWGYKKTTVDDIAKQAGVAKGTIYLHWKTREQLFKAVLVREELKLAEDVKQRIASDPEGTTLHGMVKHGTLATMKRPIWKAVFLRDTHMLGELAQSEYANDAMRENIANFKVYFDILRSQNLIRTDLDMKQLIYLINTIAMGFLLIDPFLPAELKPSDEESAEMLADTIKRTFASSAPVTADKQQEVAQAFNHYFEREIDILREQDNKEKKVL